jgi:hydroxymethylpyrimidine/phosphomethylpyrimidine kinase
LLRFGSEAVLLKGGKFNGSEITDLLVTKGGIERYTHRIFPGLFHGTGCALSSAVAAQLARDVSLPKAVETAIEYVQECLANSRAPVKGHAGLLGYCPRN